MKKTTFAAAYAAAGCLFAARPAPDTFISHRGESVDAPENTLAAFKTAVDRGFGFECDVYLSADKRVFTFHDGDLTRTTGGACTNKCSEADWETVVSKVDVAGWGKWKGSTFSPMRPALLEEVLGLAVDGRRIYVELKTGPEIVPHVKAVFAGQKKANPGNALFISFNRETCKAIKESMPEYKVYWLTNSREGWAKESKPITADHVLGALKETKADGVDCRFDPDVVTADFIRTVRDAGYEFHVWTVNSLDRSLLAFERGAQTVTTDCAKRLLDEFNARRSRAATSAFRDKAAARIAEIRATPNLVVPEGAATRYLSARTGDDAADGRTPATAWRTAARLAREKIAPGSYVLFERGGVYRGTVKTSPGVTYTAYGEGPKPCIYGSPENGADPAKWTRTGKPNVWAYDIGRRDVGTLVFDDGASHAVKVLIRTDGKTGAGFDLRSGRPFNSWRDLDTDLHFWHDYYGNGTGKVYLCSVRNPGERFKSIEFNVRCHGFAVGGACGVTIDNFTVKYAGAHGVGAGTCRDLAVRNCEFAWIGGSIQAEGIFGRDHPTRFGNAVEIYGGCENYEVLNCYVWQVYDAAVTQQYDIPGKDGAKRFDQKNVRYANNVFEKCNYSVEYFLTAPKGNPSRMENFVVEDNLMFDAGVGFCEQRPDRNEGAHVKSWSSRERNRAKNYVIRRNVFCGSDNMLLQIHSGLKNEDGSSSLPVLTENVFVGRAGQPFGCISDSSGKRLVYGPETQAFVDAFGAGNRCLFLPEK